MLQRILSILIIFFLGRAVVAAEQIYTDSFGNKHPWQINSGHTLIWEGKPWYPVGGMFVSRYLTYTGDRDDEETEKIWESDIAALNTIKEHGIKDLYINPVSGTGVSSRKFQRLIDYLEKEGFRYGIEITDGPKTPPTLGYVVPQTPCRVSGFTGTGSVSFPFDSATEAALYAVVDTALLKLVKTGNAQLNERREASIELNLPPSVYDVCFIPKKQAVPSYQNFWEGYGPARDATIRNLSALKLGPGFRFFVDPMINEMGFEPDSGLIPSSDAYRKQFAAWLAKQEPDAGALGRRWGLEPAITSFEQAARLVPLCINKPEKVGFLLDEKTGKSFQMDAVGSFYWQDVLEFRERVVRFYNRDIAANLKKKVANVPVVFKVTMEMRMRQFFVNDQPTGGFDGLGIEGYGQGEGLVTASGGYACAAALASAQPMWLVVTETMDDASRSKPDMGYPNKETMHRDLDTLKEIGAKGFFVFGLYLGGDWENFALVRDPQQLDWLREYGEKLGTIPGLADCKPKVATFPTPYADLERFTAREWHQEVIHRDSTGVWHLPKTVSMDFLPDPKPRAVEYSILKTCTAPRIDASADEWEQIPAMSLDRKEQLASGAVSWKGQDDLSASVRLMWDDRNLYLFADVKDDKPLLNNRTDAMIHQGDSMELYFGGAGSRNQTGYSSSDFQIGFSTGDGGTVQPVIFNWTRGQAVNDGEIAVAKTDFGYRLEARLPLSALGIALMFEGTRIGLDASVNDRDDAVVPRSDKSITWHGTNANWRDPSRWGIGKISGAP